MWRKRRPLICGNVNRRTLTLRWLGLTSMFGGRAGVSQSFESTKAVLICSLVGMAIRGELDGFLRKSDGFSDILRLSKTLETDLERVCQVAET